MNRQLSRALSPFERESFARDGVVKITNAIDGHWVERMLSAVDNQLAKPVPAGSGPRGAGMDRHLYPTDEAFRSFVFETDLAAYAATATNSDQIRIYFDQIFVKDANTPRVFEWHQDHPYWPIDGTQVCSTWVALTAATVEGGALEFVRGSHLWGKTYRPYFDPAMTTADINKIWSGFGDYVETLPEQIIAFEKHPDRFDILGFDVSPGDALLFDYRIVHRSHGNASDTRRVAVSWRWLGDDAIWAPVHGADPVIGPDDTFPGDGDLVSDDETFPVAYRRNTSDPV